MAIRLGTSGKNNLVGTSGLDTLYGLGNNDTLNGGVGSDTLSGGDGNDTLIGGAGPDRLHGGAGSDVFKYALFKDAAGDSIVDFSRSDRIDFAAIAAHKFIGTARFNGVAGEIRYTYFSAHSSYDPYGYSSSAYASVEIDSDGDALTDYSVRIDGDWRLKETAANSGILVAAAKQTLRGTASANSLTGARGDDSLSGLAGNDTLAGGEGKDRLLGGEGDDVLIGGRGTDTYTGGAGSDTFRFNDQDEIRSDTITDFARGDQVSVKIGGLSFVGDAPFTGKQGEYRFEDGRIEFDFDGNRQTDGYVVLQGFVGQLQLSGSDSLVVAADLNRVGTGGNNTLSGGLGNDRLSGLAGNDTLSGGEGKDRLLGGDGNDILIGGRGTDTYTGGAGSDTFRFNDQDEIRSDTITDFARDDQVSVKIGGLSFVGDAPFRGKPGEYRFEEGRIEFDFDGDRLADDYVVLQGFVGQLQLSGSDSLVVAADLNRVGTGGNNTLSGGLGNDTLSGLAGNDTLNGGGGRDAMLGGDGNDVLNGGSGRDRLDGGRGTDVLTGGLGLDQLTGGAGNDTFRFNSLAEIGKDPDESYQYDPWESYEYDRIIDLAVGDRIDLSAIAGLSFVGLGNNFTGQANQVRFDESYDETILEIDTDGDEDADHVLAVNGDDYPVIEETAAGSRIFRKAADQTRDGTGASNTLNGGNGNDTLYGLAGNDTLNGAYGKDTLNGGDGNDVLTGGLGHDELTGDDGNDILTGGRGEDELTGGAGNDQFKFNSLDECEDGDRITDFTRGDKIDLRAIDADAERPGNQAFTFVGDRSFAGIPGELRYAEGEVSGDVNGDAEPDLFFLEMGSYNSRPALTSADFFL